MDYGERDYSYRRAGPRQPLGERSHSQREGQGQGQRNGSDSNVIRVSTNRNTRFWIFLAKIYLKRFGEVEMQGFGDSISSCVRVCENLERFGYAEFSLINTITVALVVELDAEPKGQVRRSATAQKSQVHRAHEENQRVR
jgi:hypothetical protein